MRNAAAGDPTTLNRIGDAGFNRSEVAQIAAHLADQIGGRLTNSPAMRQAERWTQDEFKRWGLAAVVLASVLLDAAYYERALSRKALPSVPSVTDPFQYPDPAKR